MKVFRTPILFLAITSLILPSTILAATPDVFISEVQIAGNSADDEFVELYNQGGMAASLGGLKLCRKTSTGSLSQIKSFSASDTILSKGYFLFANSNSVFVKTYALADASTSSSALASNNSIALVDSCTTSAPPTIILDSVAWGLGKPFDILTFVATDIPTGKSLVRNLTTKSWSLSDTPTPTNRSGATVPTPTQNPIPIPSPPPTPGITTIRINELFPNPINEDDEWIELFNFGTASVPLSGWKIHDAANTAHTFTATDSIAPGKYILLPKSVSNISLNNTSETVTLLDPTGTIIDTVSYTTTIESSSYGYASAGTFRWSATPTPLAENIFDTVPEAERTDIPKDAIRGISTDFSANGNKSGMKYTWDFGDGHRSYLQNTAHTYENDGQYDGTLTISDGTESIVTIFTITVEPFTERNIRIVAFSANPGGSDTGSEWIELENREKKKKVNLIGWSIATGTKKKSIVNHPVNENFTIKQGTTRQLTSTFSHFTLPNTKGFIYLRQPDGKIVQRISYERIGGITENEVYRRPKKGAPWQWERPKLTTDNQPLTTKNQPSAGTDEPVIPRVMIDEPLPALSGISPILYRQSIGDTRLSPTISLSAFVALGTEVNIELPNSTPSVLDTSTLRTPESRQPSSDILLDINGWIRTLL